MTGLSLTEAQDMEKDVDMSSEMVASMPDLDHILSHAQEALEDHGLALPFTSHFTYKGIRFQLHLGAHSKDECLLTLSSCLGRLPFTAEDAQNRQACLTLYLAARHTGHSGVRLNSRSYVTYEEHILIPVPSDAIDLISSLTIILLTLAPVQQLAQTLASHPK